jgi:hypothetical protein
MLAEAALVLALLDRIEQASHAEPPVFQIATLIETARLLPVKPFGDRRREFLEQARRISAAIRHEPSRAVFQIETAHLLHPQDPAEAARWCRQLRAEAAARCWEPIDPVEAVRALRAVETDAEAAAAILKEWKKTAKPLVEQQRKEPKSPGVSEAIRTREARTERDDATDAEKSRLYREILELTETIENITERLTYEAAIAVWFAEHGEEAAGMLAADKLHRTFAHVCQCEDGLCDSIAGRAECSENIDFFVEYLADKKVDHAALRIRHPSVAARALVFQLKETLK